MSADVTSDIHHGIECFRLRAGGACALVSRLGAQVLSWVTADGREQLFVSARARFDGSIAIRGGVPVCFPQFSGLGALPKHGLVRTRTWQVLAQAQDGAAARLFLATGDDTVTRGQWPHAFAAEFDMVLREDRLEMTLSVRNPGAMPFAFTGALHTYLGVDDLADVRLVGLAGCEYRDAAGGNAIRSETAQEVRFDGEIDRVYHDAPRRLTLRDGARERSILSHGFADTVVWNPGERLCAALPDMEPQGYRRMVCVEAAAARLPVIVDPGAVWRGGQTLLAG